ncbi:MAG: ABC transporter substrate-binding protein, partial [Halobacteria archaeon]|nr:ABC transporter substrate-binding protein [Halobacteria archaeon]
MSGDSSGITRRRLLKSGGAAAAGVGLSGCMGGGGGGTGSGSSGGGGSSGDTVKIGVLEDRSGNFALVGTPKWRASRLAIKEINEDGGILGRQIELFDPDPQSDNQRYQQLTRRLIQQNNVDALWAGYSSATREAIRPIIDRNEQLYFYTTQGNPAEKTVENFEEVGSDEPFALERHSPDDHD